MKTDITILAIDAAWTAGQPSDVALVQQRGARWHCVVLAPSYRSFIVQPRPSARDRSAPVSPEPCLRPGTSSRPRPPSPPAVSKFLEVLYPHPALLSLLRRPRRVPYKVSKSRKYWPKETVPGRIRNLLIEFTTIRYALGEVFDGLTLELPDLGRRRPRAIGRGKMGGYAELERWAHCVFDQGLTWRRVVTINRRKL